LCLCFLCAFASKIYAESAKFTTHYALRTTPDFWAAVGVNTSMALLTLVALVGYLAPAYGRPPSFADTAVSANDVTTPIAHFDAFVNLRDYTVSTTKLAPGQPLDIDLYWEVNARPPGDYLFFVHLIDQFGNVIAQRDTHPGLGRFPSSGWQPGDRFVESIRLYLPETAYVPAKARLSIGFYVPGEGGYRLGITRPDGSGVGDALELATIPVEPRPDLPTDIPNAQTWRFRNGAELIGYEYNNRRFLPEDVLTVDLYWQLPAGDFAGDLVWLQLLDNEGHMRAFAEADLADLLGKETAVMTLAMIVPPELTPRSYRLELYLLKNVTKEPHGLVADDGRLINNYVGLAPVSVIGIR
jgi:hypothetical protein